MSLPQFSAEASLGPMIGSYQANTRFANSGGAAVVPVLAKSCSNCAVIGGFGGIRGVGMRSCCQPQTVCDPQCHTVTNCWFESCTPEVVSSPWLSF